MSFDLCFSLQSYSRPWGGFDEEEIEPSVTPVASEKSGQHWSCIPIAFHMSTLSHATSLVPYAVIICVYMHIHFSPQPSVILYTFCRHRLATLIP